MRLGWGGSYTARRQETLHAQKEFFYAVEKHAPHVVQELAQKPLEAYRLFYETLPDESKEFGASKRYGFIGGWENVSHADEYTPPQRRNVRDTLLLWAESHHLESEWVCSAALNTLHWWCRGRCDGLFYPVSAMQSVPYEPDFNLTIRHADLKLRTLEEEKRRFDEAYEQARDAYFAEAESRYEKWGKQAEVRRELRQHLEWLVFYQVHELSVPKLMKKYHRGRTTIYEGLQNAAALVSLKLQHRAGGRPRKHEV